MARISFPALALALLTGLLSPLPRLQALIRFSDLTLNGNQVLFQAQAPSPAWGPVNAWVRTDLQTGEKNLLTLPAEGFWRLSGTGRLLIQNRYGLFRTAPDFSRPELITADSFLQGGTIPEGKLMPLAVSPDGRYLVYLNPTGLFQGELTLWDTETKETTIIAANQPLNLKDPPALWSRDNLFLVYSRAGSLYYFAVEAWQSGRLPPEASRRLGPGTLRSAAWQPDNSLVYLVDDLVYRLLPEQFYTHSLYQGLFRTGSLVGRLPYPFSADRDRFWLSANRQHLLLNRNGEGLFLFPVSRSDFAPGSQPPSYMPLSPSQRLADVYWSQQGEATFLLQTWSGQSWATALWRLTSRGFGPVLAEGQAGAGRLSLSPGGTRLALLGDQGLSVHNPQNLNTLFRLALNQPRFVQWINENELLVYDRNALWRWNTGQTAASLVLMAQPEALGFDAQNRLVARLKNQSWQRLNTGLWQLLADNPALAAPVTASARWRVYFESLTGGPYVNSLLARDLQGVGTRTVISPPSRRYAAFPVQEGRPSTDLFAFGSRLRARQVSLSINAGLGAEGLREALADLADYGFKTTFFVGGEFLRRNPDATKAIAEAGHEAGNLFSLWFDFSDPRFVIDREFIQRGLARQEDDFFNLTGRELALLWHAPNYFLSAPVIQGGQDANYLYVSRDVEYPEENGTVDTPAVLQEIMKQVQPGSIIPLSLGLRDRQSGDSFFYFLDVLLNALVIQGYEVVPVSALRERAP